MNKKQNLLAIALSASFVLGGGQALQRQTRAKQQHLLRKSFLKIKLIMN